MGDATPDTWAKLGARIAPAPLWLRGTTGLLVVYAACYFLVDATGLRHPHLLTPAQNPNVAEAAAILDGRLDLDYRQRDTALTGGRVYNVYPPTFTLISLAALSWWPEGVHSVLLVLLALPLPALAYALFRRRTETVRTAVLLTLGYLLGTSLLPVLNRALIWGEVYSVNHLLSQLGLLIFLVDYFGRRRIWLGGIGLLIAIWSRQLTAVYLVPLVFAAAAGQEGAARWSRLTVAALLVAVAAALPMTLNAMKFGSPLETGYRFVYEGRDTPLAERVRQTGLFSPRYVPENLYHMNLGFPRVESVNGVVRFEPNLLATGIWWTTPILLFLWFDLRRLWTDGAARVLLLAGAGVVVGLLLYHTAGWLQLGYNRFSLDYVVVLLALIAPGCARFRRRAFTPVLVAWSVWYFRWAI